MLFRSQIGRAVALDRIDGDAQFPLHGVARIEQHAEYADRTRQREPLANANSFVAMLMVGMLMDLPAGRDDVMKLLKIIELRLPFGLLFAVCAWFVLPFGANVREAVVMCCLAPIAVFSTLFTDEVLGNAKLAGFSLSVSAIIGLVMMTGAHFLLAAIA